MKNSDIAVKPKKCSVISLDCCSVHLLIAESIIMEMENTEARAPNPIASTMQLMFKNLSIFIRKRSGGFPRHICY